MVKKRLKIYVSPFTIVMCAVIVAFGGAGQLCIYVFTITAHELAHAFTAQKLGYVLDTVKFMPYGAALSGKFETMSAKDEIIVAAAGPIANVAIAVLTTALWWMFPSVYVVTGDLATANIFTACFNALPVFQLRLLRRVQDLRGKRLTNACEKWDTSYRFCFCRRLLRCFF